jgi:V/A-type H+-transporting ATPase subunit E
MQELRSTDILDKEIQADARKKAERMLAKTDSECEKLLASVESDIEKAAREKQQFFAHKLEAFEKDRMAVVPLEKERFKVSFIQNAVMQNINKYLEGLSEEKRLALVARDFDSGVKTKLSLNAYVYGFSLSAAKKFLTDKIGSKLLSVKETKFGAVILEEDIGLEKPAGIILESEDKNFRCRLTLNEVIEKLLDTNRADLSATLFGGDL